MAFLHKGSTNKREQRPEPGEDDMGLGTDPRIVIQLRPKTKVNFVTRVLEMHSFTYQKLKKVDFSWLRTSLTLSIAY